MSNVCIVCLIGIPGSGKTKLSLKLDQLLKHQYKFNVKIVCFDNYKGFNDSNIWKSKRREIYNDVDNIIQCTVNSSNNANTIIVLDDNMYYRSMRYEYVKLARQYHIGFCQIYLDTSLTTALEFNSRRSIQISDEIIKNMFCRIEKPDPTKYSWEINSLFYLLSNPLEPIFDLILTSMNDPMMSISNNDLAVNYSQSDLHYADLSLRKLVSSKIKEFQSLRHSKDVIANLSTQLFSVKQNLISSLKNGTLLLPDTHDENISSDEKIELYYLFFCSLLN